MAVPTLTCETHGQPTRISCVDCGSPICPKCLVRTEVGTKCQSCARPADVRVVKVPKSKKPWLLGGLGLGVAVAAIVVAVVLTSGGPATTTAGPGPSLGTWAKQAGLTKIRGTTSVAYLPDGRVLAAGGGVGQIPVASTELFDPKTGRWSSTGSLITARRGAAAAVVLANGRVLLAGGVAGANLLASAELYDPSTGQWTATGSMTMPRLGDTLTLLANGDVLAAGGTTTGGQQGTGAGQTISPTATAEIYDPGTGRWTATGSMTTARFEASATPLSDGRVLIAGGLGGPGVSGGALGLQYPPLKSAEIYDPAVGAFTGAGRMADGRANQVAARLPDGSVLVAGGSGGADGNLALSTAERFDPGTGAWTSTASMTYARTGASAATLADGSVLVAGGESVDQGTRRSLSSAELFEPGGGGAWRSAGNMACARSGLGAEVLGDRSVLEVAGDTATPGQPPVAQGCVDRYYPAKRAAAGSGH